jgi:protein-tyrosine phosphatase
LQTGGVQCQNNILSRNYVTAPRITDAAVKGKSVISVLFVCTGNICRSPTAEGVFRHLVEDAGLEDEFRIASSGTESYHVGDPPDARSIRTAAKYGVSLQGQSARHLAAGDYSEFDYIFAMDSGHFSILNTRAPKNARAKIAMFLESGDVPDPWYGAEPDFEHVYALVRERCEELLNVLRKDHRL